VTETKNVSVLFYKNLKSSFSTWLTGFITFLVALAHGVASTPKIEYQVFLCIFQKNSATATLHLKEMGKFLWEARENAKKIWYYEKLVGRHASFPLRRSIKKNEYWI